MTGSLAAPSLQTSLRVQNFGYENRTLQELSGDVAMALAFPAPGETELRALEVNLEISHEDAQASITGGLSPVGELSVIADIGNLELQAINPWLKIPLDLGGQATVNFDLTGSLKDPILRGDVFVDNLQVGPVTLESAQVGPVSFREGVLRVEEFRLRNGVTEGIGDLTVPFDSGLAFPMGHLRISDASYQPLPGMTRAEFELQAKLLGNVLSLYAPTEQSDLPALPGIRGTLGSGTFTVAGQVGLSQLSLANWQQNRFDLAARFEQARLALPEAFDIQLDGTALLQNTTDKKSVVLTTDKDAPLVLSHGSFGIPAVSLPPGKPSPVPVPALDLRLAVGEAVWFRHGSEKRQTRARLAPLSNPPGEGETGYLDLGGKLSGADVTLDGVISSEEGRLAFPNGTLTLRQGVARIHREANKPPVISVEAEADGRVGDYYVSMQPSGQLYPLVRAEGGGMAPPLALNTNTIPQLDEAYVLALLVGPVVAPTRNSGSDFLTLLTDPTRSSGATGEITGVRLPPFGSALGMQEFSLDISREGPVRLRLAQRIAERLSVSYSSTLTGAVESWNLKFNFEVTPRYQIGWSVDELNKSRIEVSAFGTF